MTRSFCAAELVLVWMYMCMLNVCVYVYVPFVNLKVCVYVYVECMCVCVSSLCAAELVFVWMYMSMCMLNVCVYVYVECMCVYVSSLCAAELALVCASFEGTTVTEQKISYIHAKKHAFCKEACILQRSMLFTHVVVLCKFCRHCSIWTETIYIQSTNITHVVLCRLCRCYSRHIPCILFDLWNGVTFTVLGCEYRRIGCVLLLFVATWRWRQCSRRFGISLCT